MYPPKVQSCTECKGINQKSQRHAAQGYTYGKYVSYIGAEMDVSDLPIPNFFDPERVGAVWRFPYEERATQARDWSRQHRLRPASADSTKTWLMLIDVQNTFCIPDFELYVGGRSGRGAVEDNQRL